MEGGGGEGERPGEEASVKRERAVQQRVRIDETSNYKRTVGRAGEERGDVVAQRADRVADVGVVVLLPPALLLLSSFARCQ